MAVSLIQTGVLETRSYGTAFAPDHVDGNPMPQNPPSTRIRRRYLVEWQSGDDVVCTGFTHDISPTGGFVRSSNIPKVGETLALWLLIPNGGKLKLRCSVVRLQELPQNLRSARPSGFGIRLTDAPEEYFQLLANLFSLRFAAS